MKFGVILFPGSNCEHDCYYAATKISGEKAAVIWSGAADLPADFQDPQGANCLIIPGGFSYGDYLRCGAIARFAPIMNKVRDYAERGGRVIGICNGFQILVEAGLLPGVLHRNRDLNFICQDIFLKVENRKTIFTQKVSKDVLRVPIAHGEGNYYCDDAALEKLEKNGQIVFRYCDAAGNVSPESNPNGSRHNIAGLCNAQGNVLGMMPHPERCAEAALGNTDGRMIFESIIAAVKEKVAA
ncbi:phosphoribosylformylglycinamidine synthase subunit PurQ [Candidatus Termititenax aidoneus]|uniref:Phosphoribosylformylglycinamidine synthase subunit PurQ n=1 Tax=Termititenax aidoneus TaxID=2218524 RepID=A0A388T957_TERA1|nr:phosphoribosylformylglycinamidine synthase subunit PurQ [Candidatus Termititenax aidoneus]